METASTTPFVMDSDPTGGPPPTRIEASTPFIYVAHPERWMVLAGKVLPLLGKVKIRKGQNGIITDRHGNLIGVRAAIARKEERGWSHVPLDSVPPQDRTPGEPVSYLCTPQGRPDAHVSIYTRLYPGATVADCDEAGWVRFLEYQLTQGVIPPCPIYVLERMAQAEEDKRNKAADEARSVPSRAVDAERHGAALAAIRKEIAKRTKKAKPVKKQAARVVIDE
jgi:hypothetical protein